MAKQLRKKQDNLSRRIERENNVQKFLTPAQIRARKMPGSMSGRKG